MKVFKEALGYSLLAMSKVLEYAGKACSYASEKAKEGADKLLADDPQAAA